MVRHRSWLRDKNQNVHLGHPSRAQPAVEGTQQEFRWAPVFPLGDREGRMHGKEARLKITKETEHRACSEGSF